MSKIIKVSFLVLIFSNFISNISKAEVGAVSTATGGTGRGAVETVDGILLNPAFVAEFPTKTFSVNYSTDEWAMSVVDNGTDSYFPAGLVFESAKTDTLDTEKLGLVFSLPRWKKLVVGSNISMVEYGDKATLTETNYRQVVGDLGMTFSVNRDIAIGLVANKIGSSRIDLPVNLQLQRTTGLGMSYTYMNFVRFRFDVESAPENKTNRLTYMYGLENYVNDWVVFRLGYQNNYYLNKNFASAGLGFVGPQFSLHYAYITDAANRTDQKHLFDLGIPF
ncbi:MAG: hypothetical protein ACXWQQ_05980 [Pseudobdellovibrio sp.]